MSLEERINNDIKDAMKAKEKEKLEALRAVKSAILLAKTEKGGSEQMSSEGEIKLLQKLVKQRKDSADIYKAQQRQDLCDKELIEAGFISVYLPAQLSEADIEKEIRAVVAQVGATGPQDMGKVMGLAGKSLAGKAEGRIVADVVKRVLGSL